MTNLEYFLDNELEKDVMDVIIYDEEGNLLSDKDYDEYEVVSHKYEEKEDGKYCIINVKYIVFNNN